MASMSSTPAGEVRQRRKTPASASTTTITTPVSDTKINAPRASIPSAWHLSPELAFGILFASHIAAALYHPIQDCDEVFNYWEPTHYLTHGHGFQTWEYSPVYAIRSWTYASLHAILTLPARLLSFVIQGKVHEFYFLRIVLGFICALCETTLFSRITATLNSRIATLFLIVMATSPGMFHASISFLPSSFTMYTTMLGMAAFMNWSTGFNNTPKGIALIGFGAVIGWPFSAAMVFPFLIEELVLTIIGHAETVFDFAFRCFEGTFPTLLFLTLGFAVDSFFYQDLSLVPLNIVRYNIISNSKGPELYGTEPWHFYARNLFLNFHVWLPLALLAVPLLYLSGLARAKNTLRAQNFRGIGFLLPFGTWLLIFTLQPHKEERFMYPAYPALALSAAVAFEVVLNALGWTDGEIATKRTSAQLRQVFVVGFVAAAAAVSAFRTLGTVTAYNAPLSVYKPLQDLARPNDTVCLGKEWYRFPSHYLLPKTMRSKFIKSEFSGLLPGEFLEGDAAEPGMGPFPGAGIEPAGMNDENREDMNKYTELKYCNFLIDSHLPSTVPTKLEPNYIADTEHWERILCLPFLDASSTGIIGRLGWIPDLPLVPQNFRRVYGDYCLLKRRRRPTAGDRFDSRPRIESLG